MILLAAADPRELAREILHERRFHRASLPQPLRKPLHELGNLFDGAGRTLQRGVDAINGAIPGGAWLVWALLAAAGMAAKIPGVGPQPDPERMLETLVAIKSARGR